MMEATPDFGDSKGGNQMNMRGESAGNSQFTNMLKMAREMGCQVQPSTGNPNVLLGLCPFHESRTTQEAKTLQIDLSTTRFWCVTCHVSGNPIGFIAKAWGVSAQEAYDLIKAGSQMEHKRPIWDIQPQPRNHNGPPQAQNSAILTMAARYYRRQVEQSYNALHFLARMGITPQKAMEHGFGYCTGEGLREYLERRKATPEEIEACPLFQELTGMEFLAGCPVLADTDWTGATIWMMAILPDENENLNGTGWPTHRPRTRGIPGRRNRLFNLKNVTQGIGSVTMTDDARLYLVLEASGFPTTLITQIRRPNNADVITERIAGGLAGRNPGRIVVAMHDRELGERIGRATKAERPETILLHRSISEMMQQLDPRERNLQEFAYAGTAEARRSEQNGLAPAAGGGEEQREPVEAGATAETAADPRPPGAPGHEGT